MVGGVPGGGCGGSGCRCRGPRCSRPAAPLPARIRASPPRTAKPVIPGAGTAVSATNSPAWRIGQPRTRTRLSPEPRSRPGRAASPAARRHRLPLLCRANLPSAAGLGRGGTGPGTRGAAPGRLLPWTARGRPARTAAGG